MNELSTINREIECLKLVAERQDAEALSSLYDQWNGLLFSLIYKIVNHKEEAEEVLQEVFVQIWNKARLYNECLGKPLAWATRIARNMAIDRYRSKAYQSQRRLETEEKIDKNLMAPENPDQFIIRSEQVRAVSGALRKLPDEQRVLIEKSYYEGYSQSELAELYGLPLGTVKTRMRIAMRNMREHFGLN
jgi:RNA polymerase sigma-70 factor, ECF subfamily